MSWLHTIRERFDAFVNDFTGLGDSAADKGSAWSVQNLPQIPFLTLKAAYRSNYYARRIVDLIPQDAMVRGFRLVNPNNPSDPEDDRWVTGVSDMDILGRVTQAGKWGRAYGTGYIVPITFDGGELDRPLDLTKIYELQEFLVLDPSECYPRDYWSEQSLFGSILRPSAYEINTGQKELVGRWGEVLAGRRALHPSRVIPIVGMEVSAADRLNRAFAEGDSFLQAGWLAVARADGVDAAAALLAQEMKQDVVTVPGMAAIGTGDAKSVFMDRMRLMKLSKSILNIIILAEGETFESRATTITGFKDLSENARNALVAATGIPEPILFGKATSGLAAAPGTEQEAYIRMVEAEQQKYVPAIKRMCDIMAAAKFGVFAGKYRPRVYRIEFNPLTKESNKEREARRLIQTQRDATHIGMLAKIDPDATQALARHIIEGRYGSGGWRDDLPPFVLPPPSKPPPPPAPVIGGPPGDPNTPKPAPPGQMPSDKPPGAPKEAGAAGVDLQADNTGKGRLDAIPEHTDSCYEHVEQEILTEWVQIDAGIYEGVTVRLPAVVRSRIAELLLWEQKHAGEMAVLPDTFWRRVQQLEERKIVGTTTLRAMAEAQYRLPDFYRAQARAKIHKKPWMEPDIVYWYGWGGPAGVDWAIQHNASEDVGGESPK